jgi:hypothetical protein
MGRFPGRGFVVRPSGLVVPAGPPLSASRPHDAAAAAALSVRRDGARLGQALGDDAPPTPIGEPDPVFSFLNMADSARGHAALTSSQTLSLAGETATKRLWLAGDYSDPTLPEHWSTSGGNCTKSGTGPTASAGLFSAGGLADKKLDFGGAGRLLGAGSVADVAAGDDFVLIGMAAPASTGRFMWDTSQTASDGIRALRWASPQHRTVLVGDGSSEVTDHVVLNVSSNRNAILATFCDRNSAVGLMQWYGNVRDTATDPTGLTGSIGNGNGPVIGTLDTLTSSELVGPWEFLVMASRAGGWLDGSDRDTPESWLRTLIAQLCGQQFTVCAGSQSYPDTYQTTPRDVTIDGSTQTGAYGQVCPLESDSASVVYRRLNAASGEYLKIPAAEIPSGAKALRFWFRRNGAPSGAHAPVVEITDGTASERLAVWVEDTTGKAMAYLNASGGASGSVKSAGSVCDNDWHKIEMQFASGALMLRVDGVPVTDTGLGTPAGLDSFVIGKDTALGYSSFDIRASPSHGFHVWDQALW